MWILRPKLMSKQVRAEKMYSVSNHSTQIRKCYEYTFTNMSDEISWQTEIGGLQYINGMLVVLINILFSTGSFHLVQWGKLCDR